MLKTVQHKTNVNITKPGSRLHVDILEEKYGPIQAKVTHHDYSYREAHLVDMKGVTRTYVVTFFPETFDAGEMDIIDARIRSGMPVGTTFRKYGYDIRRNIVNFFLLNVPRWLQGAFHETSGKAKVRVSELWVRKRMSQPRLYGTAFEVLPNTLEKAEITSEDMKHLGVPFAVLQRQGMSQDELWEVLGTKKIKTQKAHPLTRTLQVTFRSFMHRKQKSIM